MKTSELTGVLLDFWAAKIEGMLHMVPGTPEGRIVGEWSPSTDWADGGPIIEREKITINDDPRDDGWRAGIVVWLPDHDDWYYGATPLIAAMRCFVASKYGDTVPDEAE